MRFRFLLSLLALLLVSCTAATSPTISASSPTILPAVSSATPAVKQPGAATSAYPAPGAATQDSGYPAPKVVVEVSPTVDPALGTVRGQIFLRGKPVNEAVLYLSDIIKDNKGNDSVVSVDYNTKNRTITNEDGTFTFVNVPIQKHFALVLIVVPNSFVLLNPKDQSLVLITVNTGEVLDIGKMDYDDLPLEPKP